MRRARPRLLARSIRALTAAYATLVVPRACCAPPRVDHCSLATLLGRIAVGVAARNSSALRSIFLGGGSNGAPSMSVADPRLCLLICVATPRSNAGAGPGPGPSSAAPPTSGALLAPSSAAPPTSRAPCLRPGPSPCLHPMASPHLHGPADASLGWPSLQCILV